MCSIDRRPPRAARGFTLIELLIFILVVGAGMAGVASVFEYTLRSSVDPLLRKQMLALGEMLLEEASSRPFTYCETTDTKVDVAVSTADCNSAQTLGSGTLTRQQFQNVPNYLSLSLPDPISDVQGRHSFPGYAATITLTATDSLGPTGNLIAGGSTPATLELLRITVTVSASNYNDSLTLESYRARYAPNAVY